MARSAVLALAVLALAASASASEPCANAVCDTLPTPPTCNCNYVAQLYTPPDSCCPEYRCAPPPAADSVNCTAVAPIPDCGCGMYPEIASFPNEPSGQCCPQYQCVRNTTFSQCDCTTCPEPPPCACPGYEPVPVVEPTRRGNDCCAVKFKCRLRDPVEFATFQAGNCTTEEEFFNTTCGGDCTMEARLIERASGKNDVCCPTFGCRALRKPKCCSQAEIDACPPVNASCACPQLTRIIVAPADPLEGRCCPVTECHDIDQGADPDCSVFEPLCNDACEEAVTVKRANPEKGRCCPVRRCEKIRGCKSKPANTDDRRRRRRRRRRRNRRN